MIVNDVPGLHKTVRILAGFKHGVVFHTELFKVEYRFRLYLKIIKLVFGNMSLVKEHIVILQRQLYVLFRTPSLEITVGANFDCVQILVIGQKSVIRIAVKIVENSSDALPCSLILANRSQRVIRGDQRKRFRKKRDQFIQKLNVLFDDIHFLNRILYMPQYRSAKIFVAVMEAGFEKTDRAIFVFKKNSEIDSVGDQFVDLIRYVMTVVMQLILHLCFLLLF